MNHAVMYANQKTRDSIRRELANTVEDLDALDAKANHPRANTRHPEHGQHREITDRLTKSLRRLGQMAERSASPTR